MDPALSQTLYQHIGYPLSDGNKYSAPDRAFTNPAAFTSNDFSYIPRRSPNGLNNSQLGQTLSVPTNAVSDYNSTSSSVPEVYPPASVDNANSIATSTPFDFSTSAVSRLATSNASSSDHFSNTIPPFTDPIWNNPMMSDFRRPIPTHPQMTPPLTYHSSSYHHSNVLSGLYGNQSNRPIEHFPPTLYQSRSLNGPEIHHGHQRPHISSPTTINHLPVPLPPYPLTTAYPHMQLHPASRAEGPPFEETKVVHSLCTGRNHQLSPEIQASIQKGFFQVEGKWTCYRRNYFTVLCAFSFKSGNPDGPVYLQRLSQLEPVQQYAVSISAKTANGSNQESETRQLVQHTPKRDKATESVPGRHIVQPAPPQSLQHGGMLPTASLYAGGHPVTPSMMSAFDAYGPQNHMPVPINYTFERIQFQKATANNGKRRAQQQYFHVVVELSVNIGRPGGEDNWVLVATRQSSPMVVRGRSPGHYKDNIRRDSQTNMDPDRGSGGSGDGAPTNRPMTSFLGTNHSSPMDWTSSHRHSHHYGSSYSRLTCISDCSPTSASSSSTLTRSPTRTDFSFAGTVPTRTDGPYDIDRPALTPITSLNGDNLMARGDNLYGNRRSSDEETSDYENEFYNSTSYVDENLSPRAFEYAGAASIRPLCAS